jgi:hypothetical protein
MAESESQAPAQVEQPRSQAHHRRFRLTAVWIAVALIAILSLAQLIGVYIHNLNQTRMGAIFGIGVVSFLGTLSLGHQGERYRPVDPSEVRMALTTSFAMVFFAAVGIFLFSSNSVGDFGRTLMSNLTSLFGIVIGFYFASSAAIEYGKIRAGKSPAEGSGEPAPAAGTRSSLEAKVAELEATVARLAAAAPAALDGHETSPAGAEPSPSVSGTRD